MCRTPHLAECFPSSSHHKAKLSRRNCAHCLWTCHTSITPLSTMVPLQLRIRADEVAQLRQRLDRSAAREQQLQQELESVAPLRGSLYVSRQGSLAAAAAAATNPGFCSGNLSPTSPQPAAAAVRQASAGAGGASAPGAAALQQQVHELRQAVSDRTAEIERLQSFLLQLYETANGVGPEGVGAAGAQRGGNEGVGLGGENLAVRLQQGVRALVVRLGEQQAELQRLQAQARESWRQQQQVQQQQHGQQQEAQWPQAISGRAAAVATAIEAAAGDGGATPRDEDGQEASMEASRAEAAELALAEAHQRVALLQQQCAELEEANAACMQELNSAAARLAASEQQLLSMVQLQRQHEELRARHSELLQRLVGFEKGHMTGGGSMAAGVGGGVDGGGAAGWEAAGEEAKAAGQLREQVRELEGQLWAARDAQRRSEARAAALEARVADAEALMDSGSSGGTRGPGDEEKEELRARCGELAQCVARLQRQVAEADAAASKLHAANAALQERLSALQVRFQMFVRYGIVACVLQACRGMRLVLRGRGMMHVFVRLGAAGSWVRVGVGCDWELTILLCKHVLWDIFMCSNFLSAGAVPATLKHPSRT